MDLTGKKTYIISVGAICYAIGGYVSGYVDLQTAIHVIMTALGLAALRNGVSTSALNSVQTSEKQ